MSEYNSGYDNKDSLIDPENKTGHAHAEGLEDGPKRAEDRHCTDILCAILWVATLIAAIVLVVVASNQQDANPQNDILQQPASFELLAEHASRTALQSTSSSQKFSFSASAAIVVAISFVISIILLFLTPCIATPIMWLMILLNPALLIFFGVFFLQIDSTLEENAAEGIAISCFVTAALYLLIVICLRKRIKRVCILIKGASVFVRQNISSLIISLFSLVFLVGVFVLYAWGMIIFIFKYSFPKPGDVSSQQTIFIASSSIASILFLWTCALSSAYVTLSFAIYIGQWYFSYNRGGEPHRYKCQFLHAIWWPLRYHFGSLALGSLIVVATSLLSVFVRGQAKKEKNCLSLLLLCCAKCFEEFVERFTSSAYIMMAITGDNFCQSAKEGFVKVIQNFGDFLMLNRLGGYYSSFGMIFVAIASTAIGLAVLEDGSDTLDYFGALIAFFLISMTVANLFMGVMSIACDCCLFFMTIDIQTHGKVMHGPNQLDEINDACKEVK